MASAEARVHKLSAEAFSRLKNDHEQFLEAYEKPTQIYRFLRARHALKSLFLHRNLTYMQHRNSRRGKKRSKRIRVDDLLRYRKERKQQGVDLSSQIKSDNFLEISFHQLQKGIDFNSLLSTALSGHAKETPPTCSAPCPMEVEVLLYSFHHPSSEALPSSYPCSSLSLGKFELQYNVSENTHVASASSSLTLTIPESKLVWQGNSRGIGAQMLVFRARPSPGQKPSPTPKKSLHRSLASVSVELNRINRSDIVQLTRTRQGASAQAPAQVSSFTASDAPTKLPRPSQAVGGDQTPRAPTQSSSSGAVMENHSEVGLPFRGGNRLKAISRKLKSKAKEKRDACIMTDISLGTDTAVTDSISSHSTSNGHLGPKVTAKGDKQKTATPPLPKKGFAENCSSSLLSKFPVLKNALSLNGLSLPNGYPEEDNCPEEHCGQTKSAQEPCSNSHDREDDTFLDQSETECSLTVSIPYIYCSASRSSSTSSLNSDTSHLPSYLKKKYKGSARKRSEIQLLLDGDKPRGERISAEEIPVFTAEDLASRATRSNTGTTAQSRGSWTQLGTGTRKITPVEPLTYPLSPTFLSKRVGGINGQSRKRSHSDSDHPIMSPDNVTPPLKLPRLAEEERKGEGERGGKGGRGRAEGEGGKEEERARAPPRHSSPPPPPPPPPPRSEGPTEDTQGQSSLQSFSAGDVFSAEIVVFDSRGECLLEEGEYSIFMQKCPKKESASTGLTSFTPLTWSSVFGGEKNDEVAQSENMMLKFSLRWSKGSPKYKLVSELEMALDLQRIRNDYFPSNATQSAPPPPPPPLCSESHSEPTHPPPLLHPHDSLMQKTVEEGSKWRDREDTERPVLEEQLQQQKEPPLTDQDKLQGKDPEASSIPAVESATASRGLVQCPPDSLTAATSAPFPSSVAPGNRNRIIYNFLYHNNTLQQTESRGDMRCLWCSLVCGKLYSLLKHMSLCHPRFLFTYTPMEGGSVIDVHVNKLYEAGQSSVERDPVVRSGMSLRQCWRGPLKCLPCTAVIVERHEKVEEDLSEFLNDGSWKRGYNVNRQYYHSHSCLPLVPEEMDVDSESEEAVSQWQKLCSQKMIDEFTDVNRGEKEMMKLWNLFAMEQGLTAYKQIPNACLRFAQERGPDIVQKNIVHSFMAHLISLCDFGLIPPSIIKSCMDVIYALPS